ncbi:MAG: hypothetical protein SVY15_08390 [Halobacteriota archaeon]|nr:hypothetical protein [Halobacteriota archaeon]
MVDITLDDIEWFRVYAFLLKKVENKEKGEDYRIGTGEWRDLRADFEKLRFIVEELGAVRAIDRIKWYSNGGAYYVILDIREFKRLLFRKGIHRLKEMGITPQKIAISKRQTMTVEADFKPVSPFICHSKIRRDFAEKLSRILIAKGMNTWFDEWEIPFGDSMTQ